MSKIRIYELAKELGLDNKVILDLSMKLGIVGKKSHSSSLEDSEAEAIRRAVIRSAVSSTGGIVKEVRKEGELLTEQRKGNVIRRRKKSDSDTTGDQGELESELSLASQEVEEHQGQEQAREEDQEGQNVKADHNELREEIVFTERAEQNVPSIESVDIEAGQISQSDNEQVEIEELNSPVEDLSLERREGIDVRPIKVEQERRGARVIGKIELPKRRVEQPASGGAVAQGSEAKTTKPAKKKRQDVVVFEEDEFQSKAKKKVKKQILRKDDLLDYEGEREILWKNRRDKKKKADQQKPLLGADGQAVAVRKVIKINHEISVGDLAHEMGIKTADVIKCVMNLGIMATINHLLDVDTAQVVADEYGHIVQNIGTDVEQLVSEISKDDEPENMILRSPVVTVMGHVDHGKTSLLDAIRKTSVTAKEAGGITQHIGAYTVPAPSGGFVTFLDTPGHAAFTEMRGRGARVTDIVVLVVAADDGVMPQTIEAINHAKSAQVPIIVAVNKIDKPSANVDRVKQQLSEHGLISEEWGGDTIFVNVSAKTGVGLDLLLENLHVQAEVLELKANPNRSAIGTVVESRLDRARGAVISVLVQRGTLKKGDSFVVGSIYGKVKALHLDNGKSTDEAGPSVPVEILGAAGAPLAGEGFYVVENESVAREIASHRALKDRIKSHIKPGVAFTKESFATFVSTGETKELPLIVKADVQGSVEALASALEPLRNDEVSVKVVHRGVGGITENDVSLARASSATIFAFNIRADARVAQIAEKEGVRIIHSRVIYEVVDFVKQLLSGMLAPKFIEETLGRVEVRETFRVPRLGLVAGSYVLDGTVQRGASVRLLRDNKVVFEGKMASLRRFKDDVREVQAGYECGIGIEGYNDIKAGDIIEVYKMAEVEASVH